MATKKIISFIICLLITAGNAVAEEWKFDAVLNNKVVGQHVFTLENNKMISKADFHIEFLFMDIYYQHKSEEIWAEECLSSISSNTNDDGDLFEVNGNNDSGSFLITTKKDSFDLPSCIMTFAYWNPKVLEQDNLLNAQNGQYLEVKTTMLKKENLLVRGKNIATNCYEMIASKAGQEKLKIRLWYDQDMQWVALKSPTPIGDIFYKLH